VEPGNALERGITDDLTNALPSIDSSRAWAVQGGGLITAYAQYAHLLGLDVAIEADPNVAVTIGRDYLIRPDVTVGIDNIPAHEPLALLHAAVSCKWTIRSDRVQNVRHEFGRMIRHRRGRLPHLVAVTAEPLPSRLVSIARGTGEVDDVYHMTYRELHEAVLASNNAYQAECWREITGQKRIRDYNELAENLASW